MPLDPQRVPAIFLEAASHHDPTGRGAILDRECEGNNGSVKVPGLHPQPIFSGRLLCYRACFTWSALARSLSTGDSHV
jgi:hypothetical protein